MSRPIHLLRVMTRPVVDFALPPRCPGCGAVVRAVGAFCYDCWSGLDFLDGPCCEACALPFDLPAPPGTLCAGCQTDPPPFARMRAAVAYGPLARTVALKLKYGRRPGMARTMGALMVRHLDAAEAPLLCPVPLHRWRIWQRGYNQSALLAADLGRRTGTAVHPDLLRRTRATAPLKGMSPAARRRTVNGAFALKPTGAERIRGRVVVLVDDVFTSGATAAACARVLRRAGAARVEVLCWARVVRDD